jgi:hypothetical protein
MGGISNKQIYDLALDILSDVVELEASIDVILGEMRRQNRDMSPGKQCLAEVSQNISGALPT